MRAGSPLLVSGCFSTLPVMSAMSFILMYVTVVAKGGVTWMPDAIACIRRVERAEEERFCGVGFLFDV